MPVLPTGQIVDSTGKPTGQTVNLGTGAVGGDTNTGQNAPGAPTMPMTGSPTGPDTSQGSPGASTAPGAFNTSSVPNLQPGSKGEDVSALQNFLIGQGFNIPAGATGNYGAQTKAALSQFQSKQGIDTAGYAGFFGPKTKSAIAQNQDLAKKFQAVFDQKKGQQTPQSGSDARSAIADATATPQSTQGDPQQNYFDQYFGMNPVVKSLYDSVTTALSSTTAKTSFVDEYNKLRADSGVPELQTELLNINNVMRGTDQDIRNEIAKAGGTATESQVEAMSAARNKVLMNRAQYLSDALAVKNDYVNEIVNLTQADQTQVNNQLDRQIGFTEKLATLQKDMNTAAASNYDKIVTNIGYNGLANALKGNPAQMNYAENLLGLPKGSLSNPTFIENAKTLKEQTLAATVAQRDVTNALAMDRLAQSAQRIQISVGNTGAPATDVVSSQLDYYKATGQLPSFGYGAAGQAARNAFWKAVAADGSGTAADAATNKAIRSSMSKALGTQQNQLSATQTSTETLNKQLDLADTLSKKTDRSGSPILNKYLLYLKGQYAGDPDTVKLQNAVKTASAEFAKILSGSAASISGATVSSQQEAESLLNAQMSSGQLSGVIQQMKQEGGYRLSSQQHTIDQLKTDLQNVGKTEATADDTFRQNAKAQGYSDAEIDAYLKGK